MCTVVCNGECRQPERKQRSAGWVVLVGFVIGVAVITRTLWRWLTGAPMFGNRSGRRQRFTRGRRAQWRCLGTVVAVGAVLDWQITLLPLAAGAVGYAGTRYVQRRRRTGRVSGTIDGEVLEGTIEPSALAGQRDGEATRV
jgi:hypothetical protein